MGFIPIPQTWERGELAQRERVVQGDALFGMIPVSMQPSQTAPSRDHRAIQCFGLEGTSSITIFQFHSAQPCLPAELSPLMLQGFGAARHGAENCVCVQMRAGFMACNYLVPILRIIIAPPLLITGIPVLVIHHKMERKLNPGFA